MPSALDPVLDRPRSGPYRDDIATLVRCEMPSGTGLEPHLKRKITR